MLARPELLVSLVLEVYGEYLPQLEKAEVQLHDYIFLGIPSRYQDRISP